MSEMHLRQPGFKYSACVPFTENKERIRKFKETGDLRYIYQNELDKAGFQHVMAYGDFKDLTRRTASDKILCDKWVNIAKNPKYDGHERGLASMVHNFFDKNTSGRTVKNEDISNKELAEDLHKPIIGKLNKRKARSTFIDNIWGTYLADMQLIIKFNLSFLLSAVNAHGLFLWKIKKVITTANALQKLFDESNHKPNKIWVDKGSEFCNRSMKSWLEKNAIEMYSTNNVGKSVIFKRFVRTLKNKIHKHMTLTSENVYIDKLDDIDKKYNNTYHRTIKWNLLM